MQYNDKIKLNPSEMNLIESALRSIPTDDMRYGQARALLANLYHQKNWYRPKDKIYVSG